MAPKQYPTEMELAALGEQKLIELTRRQRKAAKQLRKKLKDLLAGVKATADCYAGDAWAVREDTLVFTLQVLPAIQELQKSFAKPLNHDN